MQYRPVHWTEGMFLRPQHFQAADRYWHELVATSHRCDNPYDWGIRSVEISEEALSNYQVQITQCTARTRDGSLIDFQAGQGPDRADLKAAFEQQSDVTVYVAIPKLTLGRANLGARFTETTLPVSDESRGGGEQEIGFRDQRVVIKLSTEDLQGFEALPIARVLRVGAEDALPVLDNDYFPPLLAVDAWKPLGVDIVQNITDFIGQRIELLSRRVIDRGLTFNSQEPGDLDELLKLLALNEAFADLSVMAFARGVHPFVAYSALCHTVGRLSIFGPTRRTPDDIPKYDHDDLARIFRWIEIRIRELILGHEPPDEKYEQRNFVGRQLGMRVKIKSEWLHSAWKWYVGVNGQNVSNEEVRELLAAGRLDWKIGSDREVDNIFNFRVPDVDHVELERVPRVLPAHKGWIYYEIRRDSDNAAWRDVLAEESLALRFAPDLIGNKEKLPGQRRLELILPTKRAMLEFALFAVPMGSQK